MSVFQAIVKAEGYPGLYKGIQSQLFRTVLATALLLATKERIAHGTAKFLPLIVFAVTNPTMAAQIAQAQMRSRRRRG